MIYRSNMDRYHHAAKIIETDGINGYHTVREKYGEEVANFLLVAFLRRNHNPEGLWPAPDDIIDNVQRDLDSQDHIRIE